MADGWIPTRVGRYDELTLGEVSIYYERYNRVLDLVVARAGLSPDDLALDIGCGTGELSRRLGRTGARVLAVDPSGAMLRRAEEKASEGGWGDVDLVLSGDPFLRAPACPGRFAAVVSTYAFHHVEPGDKRLAVREMVRLLEPGGRVVLGDPMFENRAELEAALVRWEDQLEEEHFALHDELAEAFSAAGLTFHAERVSRINWVVTGRV